MSEFVSIGYTKKPHGLKGEIKIEVEEAYLDDLLEMDVVVLVIKGKQTPFFLEDVRIGNSIIAKFEDVDTPEAALSIGSKEILAKASDLKIAKAAKEAEGFGYDDCVGFKIFDDGKEIGIIDELVEYPQQLIALVTYEGREVMIPLNEHFIQSLSEKKREIQMSLPEGLLDL